MLLKRLINGCSMRIKVLRDQRIIQSILFFMLTILPMIFLTQKTSEAFSTVPLSLQEMQHHADRIFVGLVQEVHAKAHPAGFPTIVTLFQVITPIKGQLGKTVQLTQIGMHRNSDADLVPSGLFHVGKEYLVFLHRDSTLGLSSPVGFALGKIAIVRNHEIGDQVHFTPMQQQVFFTTPTLREKFGTPQTHLTGPAIFPLDQMISWLKEGGK